MAKQIDQKITFVTGKGGVGKSTVAAALALKFASNNQKTLLVELTSPSYFGGVWNVKSTFEPKQISPNLFLSLWTPKDCLREYALHLLKVEALYKLFLENQVSKTLIQVAPGLNEIALLGKATSYPRKVGPPLEYDRIVIDAPASGHFMSLIRAPLGLSRAIRFGPMGEQSRSILSYMNNVDYANYMVVTLPEELPLQEGKELADGIRGVVGFNPTVVLNRSFSMATQKIQGESSFSQYLTTLDQSQKQFVEMFKEFKTLTLPWVLKESSLEIIEQLSESQSL